MQWSVSDQRNPTGFSTLSIPTDKSYHFDRLTFVVSLFLLGGLFMEYQLELKQIVDFPRCRIYRNFIQTLLNDRSIRTTGGSFLFWYLILCSYANYSNSNRRMDQLTYTLSPGEWICSISELQDWFRCRFQHQAISILKHLQEEGCITYSLLKKPAWSNSESPTGRTIILP